MAITLNTVYRALQIGTVVFGYTYASPPPPPPPAPDSSSAVNGAALNTFSLNG